MWDKIIESFNKANHLLFGCKDHWATQLNKNKKPFKRYCCICDRRQFRKNGEWVG